MKKLCCDHPAYLHHAENEPKDYCHGNCHGTILCANALGSFVLRCECRKSREQVKAMRAVHEHRRRS